MLSGAGLMLGGSFKCFGGFMLAAGSSTLSWTGLGVLGMAAGGFVVGAGASDINQGGEEFFLGMSGDSTTQTRNGMSDLFYDGNDTIYHLSTGVAAFAGSLLTPYVNAAYGKTGTTAAGSATGNGGTAGTTTAGEAMVTEAAGGTVDDALEQFYDDIFESSYGEQFDPIKEQAIVGMESGEGGSGLGIPNTEPSINTGKEFFRHVNFKKPDIKMVNDAANQIGIDRKGFGNYIHEIKDNLNMRANQNFTYQELLQLAEEFKKMTE